MGKLAKKIMYIWIVQVFLCMNFKNAFFIILTPCIFFATCKKDNTTKNQESKNICDSVVGNYLVSGTHLKWSAYVYLDTTWTVMNDTLFITKGSFDSSVHLNAIYVS